MQWHKVRARCPKCQLKHWEWDCIPQKKGKNGKDLDHRIECDNCLRRRITPSAYEEYCRVRGKLR